MGSSSAHSARRRIRGDRLGALAGELVKAQPTGSMDGILSCKGLPAPDGDIDQARLDLDRVSAASDPLCCQDGCAGAAECIEHDVAAAGTVLDGIRHQRDRFDRRMALQLIFAFRTKCVDAGVVPDIGAGAAVAAELDVADTVDPISWWALR